MKKKIMTMLVVLTLAMGLTGGMVFAADDEVTVTFIDENSEQEVSYTYTSGDEITLPDNLFETPSGYVFAGWLDSESSLWSVGATYTVTADTYFFTWYQISEDEEEEESETVVSGSCGDNAVWTYDPETKTLTISGTGEIYDYDYGETPWYEYTRPLVKGITSIVIEDGITGIGEYAFAYIYGLESVTFSDTVTTIGACAFLGSGLSEIIVGKNVVTIGDGAFEECTYLNTIYIPLSVESIGEYAIYCYSVMFNVTIYYQGTEADWALVDFAENFWTEECVDIVYECENVWGSSDSDSEHDWTYTTVYVGSYGTSTKTTYTCSDCGEEKTVISLYAADRYKTASEIVENTFESCTYAVIASGSDFPDALAAASLAGALDAPIMITSDTEISNTLTKLDSLGVTDVYIVGGTSSVSAAVQSKIEAAGIGVERLAGGTRQETALAVAEEVQELTTDDQSDICFVATGKVFADALSISAYSYWASAPIYLTNNNGNISDDALAAIEAAGYSQIVILGGTASVSEDTETALEAIEGVTVERLGGETRYETAELIAEWSVSKGMSYDGMIIADGTNFPDALVASALCGQNGSVMLLAAKTAEGSSVLKNIIETNAGEITNLYIVGGPNSVTEEVRNMITAVWKG